MTKELISYQDMQGLAEHFIKSGLFKDSRDLSQAIVKIQAGQEMGLPPFAAMSGIAIIKGKPTIGAGIMAASIKSSGKYDYIVREQTDTICKIEYFQGKNSIGISEFSKADAVRSELWNKDNWKHYPKNMLFARAMSNGVKWYCPDVFSSPVYVPEELEEVTPVNISYEVVENENTEQNLVHQEQKEIELIEQTTIIDPIEEVNNTDTKEALKEVMKKYNGLTKTNQEYKLAIQDKIEEFLKADLKDFNAAASDINNVPGLMDLAATFTGLINHPVYSDKLEEALEVHSSCIRQKEKAKQVMKDFVKAPDLDVIKELKIEHQKALDTDPALRKKVKDIEELLSKVLPVDDLPPF